MSVVEVQLAGGHAASVLAKQVIDAIEEYVNAGKATYADVARAAGMQKQQLKNIQMFVAANENHVIKSDVAERLAAAIGLRWSLEPAAPEKGGRS
jgi:hypothetical protein